MSNSLKKILFFLLILMIPYLNSASKAEDLDEQSSIPRSMVRAVDQANMEDSKNPWTSSLASSAKNAAWEAYNIVDYVTRNPSASLYMGLILGSQVLMADASCACYCWYFGSPKFFGCARDVPYCVYTCGTHPDFPYDMCLNNTMGCH